MFFGAICIARKCGPPVHPVWIAGQQKLESAEMGSDYYCKQNWVCIIGPNRKTSQIPRRRKIDQSTEPGPKGLPHLKHTSIHMFIRHTSTGLTPGRDEVLRKEPSQLDQGRWTKTEAILQVRDLQYQDLPVSSENVVGWIRRILEKTPVFTQCSWHKYCYDSDLHLCLRCLLRLLY